MIMLRDMVCWPKAGRQAGFTAGWVYWHRLISVLTPAPARSVQLLGPAPAIPWPGGQLLPDSRHLMSPGVWGLRGLESSTSLCARVKKDEHRL